MTRHSKNCTAHSIYTHAEKQRDAKTSGYGSQEARLGKDSVKEFDCCCLTLQPCKDAMVTPDGYLYDKEAILEYIVKQKCEIAKRMKNYQRQKNKDAEELRDLAKAEHRTKVEKFIETNSLKTGDDDKTPASTSLSNMAGAKAKEMPSFWLPSLAPQAAADRVEKKPDDKVRCPMSGKVLQFRDLIPAIFTEAKDNEKKSLIVKRDRYKCAVTGDILTNSTACVVLRTSGSVVTVEALEKLVRKDMQDPINGKALKESDIIYLQRGSSGFAASGLKLVAKKGRPVMQT